MGRSTIELELPDDVIEGAQGIARDCERSIESVLQEGIAMLFGDIADSEASPDLLADLDDEQLWTIVNRPMPWAQESRLRELTARSKGAGFAEREAAELENLLAALDRQILLRSKVLLQMKRRGLDVDSYLGI